jgi:hypothetical protein
MKAVWLVRSRQLESRMRFWTAIVGYNPRDRSLSQRIYLIYVVIFFSLWGFAVLALLASLGAGLLSLLNSSSPVQAAASVMTVVLLADALLRAYKAAVSSPFVFSEEDAALICQTPVDRRQVAIAWLLGDWLPAGLPFWAGAVTLSFACSQLAVHGRMVWADLPIYLLAGLRAVMVVLPLHLALMTAGYAFGALRLRGGTEIAHLRWIPIVFGVLMIALAITAPKGLQAISWPVFFPLEAGFGGVSWLAGFGIAVILAGMGALALYLASAELNLSRAAQESHFRWLFQQVGLLGDSSLVKQMKARQRLGVGHQASRIPARAGVWALIWKDWVQSLRGIDFRGIISWLILWGVFLGLVIATDWGSRIWAFVLWGLSVGQRGTERFHADLSLWVVFRQLPFSTKEILLVEVAGPVIAATILTWLAVGVGSLLGFQFVLWIILLVPGVILGITLASAFDILRQSHTSDLLVGNSPELGAVGLILGLLVAGVPLALVSWISSHLSGGLAIWFVSPIGLLLSLVIAYGVWQLSATEFKNIK